MLDAAGLALDAPDHPLQHPHVLAVARPNKLALIIGAEPVDAEDRRQFGMRGLEPVAQIEPVAEVVGHVVAAKRQHRERVTTHDALRTGLRRGGLGAHGRGHVDALNPVAGLGDQRHGGRTSTAEDEGIDRHALGIVPLRIDHRILRSRHGKARIRMRGLAATLAVGRRPVLALPVDQVSRRLFGHALPPDIAVIGERDIGKDDIAL